MMSETASDAVAERVRELRKGQGLKASDLAAKCHLLGLPHLTAATISNIETGRRDQEGRRRRTVSIDELLVLALALNVAPVHLLVPPDSDGPYQVTPTRDEDAFDVRAWVRGFALLEGTDPRTFWSEVPAIEFGVRDDHPQRHTWVEQVVKYLSRSMGRLYRRDDGAAAFEVTIPAESGQEGSTDAGS